MSARIMLDAGDLHGALADPAIEAMNFLNEIMARYPEAISFAPGAPYEPFFEAIDIAHYIDVWTDYLRGRGHDDAAVRRALFQYGPSRGLIDDLIAGMLARDEGINVAAESVAVTVGCQEALFLVARVLCGAPGDTLAVVEPAYVGMAGAALLLDVPLAAVGSGAPGIDFDSLAAAVTTASAAGRKIRALYVAPDHANPSGIQMDLATRMRLLAEARRHGFLILEDTAYRFTAATPDRPPTLKALDRDGRVIQLGTFAKICAPGVRVGYIVADQDVRGRDGRVRPLAAALATAKSMVTLNTSALSQAVIGGMIVAHGGSLASLAEERGAHYRANIGYLREVLQRFLPPSDLVGTGVSWDVPAGGFFGRLTLPVPADAELLDRCAASHGVLWTPLRDFYRGPDGDYAIRLSCSYLTRPQIEEGVSRLARFVVELCTPAAVDSRRA